MRRIIRPFFGRLFRRVFTRKTFVRLAFAVALLATLILAIHLVEGWRGRRAWATYRADAERRGVKLTLADYLPPATPDAENYAAIPLFEEVFRASKLPDAPLPPSPFELPEMATHGSRAMFAEVSGAAKTPVTKALAGIKRPDPKADLARSIRMRSLGDMGKGELIDLAAWRDRFVETKLVEAPTEEPARDILRGLERYEPALQQLRDAGSRPHARFPVEWDLGINALLPHLNHCQSAAKLLALRIATLLALGDSAAAHAEFRHGLRLYRALENEPVLITGLVRISILAILANPVWGGLASNQWADAELALLQADFASLRLLEDYVFAMNSERAGANGIMAKLEHASSAELAQMFLVSSGIRGPARFYVRATVTLVPRGWLPLNSALINQMHDAALARFDLANGVHRPDDAVERRLQEMADSPLRNAPYFLTRLLMPVVSGTVTRWLFTHTCVQQVAAACALERFRRARGAYPETLAQLVPEFLGAVPIDVMDGAPLRYRQTPNGRFELWSVGMNRTNEQAAPNPKKRGLGSREQPDWVWRYPAK